MSPRFVDSTRERIRRWLWLLSLLWLAVACCVLGYDLWSEDFSASWVSRIYFGATLLFSGAAFGMYGWDKRQAQLRPSARGRGYSRASSPRRGCRTF